MGFDKTGAGKSGKSITFNKKTSAEKRSRRNWKETYCMVDL